MLPLASVFKCQPGWPRLAMAAYTEVVAGSGIVAVTSLLAFGDTGDETKSAPGALLFGVFIIGVILAGWVANLLIMQRPRR